MQKVLLFVVSCTFIGAVFGAAGDACLATGSTSVGTLPAHCTVGTTILKADNSAAYCDCTTVAAGYFEQSQGSATADSVIGTCHQNCATCSGTGNDKCNTCNTDMVPETTAPTATVAAKCCPKSCATCATENAKTNSLTNCNTCATGYGSPKATPVSATNAGACTQCTGTNCGTCDSAAPTICTSCPAAYYSSADNKTCTACPSNCTSCPNGTFCTTCNGSLQWNNGSQKCFGSILKVGSVVGSLLAVAVFALVF